MPIYEYRCDNCGDIFDEFIRTIDGLDIVSICPKCVNVANRILSPVYSNFTSWSETLDRQGKWATQHEDFSEC